MTKKLIFIIFQQITANILSTQLSNGSTIADYHNPCNYPAPVSVGMNKFFSLCSSLYLNSSLFCDKDAMLTFTDAQRLSEMLQEHNFSTCFCNDHTSADNSRSNNHTKYGHFTTDDCNDFKIAIILIEKAALTHNGAIVHNERTWCELYDQKNLHNLHLENQMQQYALMMQQDWLLERRCNTDLFLIFLQSWFGRDPQVSYIISVASDRLKSLLPSDEFVAIATVNRKRDSYDGTYKALRNYLENILHALRKERQKNLRKFLRDNAGFVPNWAWISILCCIVFVPICVFIGNLASSPSYKTSAQKSDQVTIRLANQRWRTSLANVFSRGSKETKKRAGNLLMFRNFNKNKDGAGHGHVNYV